MKNEVTPLNVIDQLVNFVNSKPCISARDYISGWNDSNGRSAYFKEVREVAKDRSDFYQLLEVAQRLIDRTELQTNIFNALKDSNGRLLLVNGQLTYHVGQYFATEYRPAVNWLLQGVLWRFFYFRMKSNNIEFSNEKIRKQARKYFSRRVYQNYFA